MKVYRLNCYHATEIENDQKRKGAKTHIHTVDEIQLKEPWVTITHTHTLTNCSIQIKTIQN